MKPHRLWMYTILIARCGVANVLAHAQSEPRGRVHVPVSCSAAALTRHSRSFPWSQCRWGEARTVCARALGAARSGEGAQAGQEVATRPALHRALVEATQGYGAAQVERQRRAAAAWVAHAEGRHAEAVTLMQSAAALEGSTEHKPVTPGPLVPARELLGELLREWPEPRHALTEVDASIPKEPNRLKGLYGAARAAGLVGDVEKARPDDGKLVALCAHSATDRPELQEATAFLAPQ